TTLERVEPKVWLVAWSTLVGGMSVLFATTIVAVAVEPLAGELGVPLSSVQWISTGYLLALAMVIPITPWAQRRVGGRRLWLYALAGFTVASVLAALAWDAPSLIAFRVLQGAAAGIVVPLMSTLVIQAAAGKGLARARGARLALALPGHAAARGRRHPVRRPVPAGGRAARARHARRRRAGPDGGRHRRRAARDEQRQPRRRLPAPRRAAAAGRRPARRRCLRLARRAQPRGRAGRPAPAAAPLAVVGDGPAAAVGDRALRGHAAGAAVLPAAAR